MNMQHISEGGCSRNPLFGATNDGSSESILMFSTEMLNASFYFLFI